MAVGGPEGRVLTAGKGLSELGRVSTSGREPGGQRGGLPLMLSKHNLWACGRQVGEQVEG